jgi:hypothetical protein
MLDTEQVESKWRETLTTTYDYWLTKKYCPDCDSKRTKPCKCRLAKLPKEETLK